MSLHFNLNDIHMQSFDGGPNHVNVIQDINNNKYYPEQDHYER